MCVHSSQPTKIMVVDTKYKNGKQILLQTLQIRMRLADHLVNEFIMDFFVIINS